MAALHGDVHAAAAAAEPDEQQRSEHGDGGPCALYLCIYSSFLIYLFMYSFIVLPMKRTWYDDPQKTEAVSGAGASRPGCVSGRSLRAPAAVRSALVRARAHALDAPDDRRHL